MRQNPTHIRRLANQVQDELANNQHLSTEMLHASLAERAKTLLLESGKASGPAQVSKIMRNTVWACVFNQLRQELKETPVPPTGKWALVINGTDFQRASYTVRDKMSTAWRKFRGKKENHLLLDVFRSICPLDRRSDERFFEISSQGAAGNMDKISFGFSIGSGTFQHEMYRNADGLNAISVDKADFLRLYDQSFRYVYMLALAPIESIDSSINHSASNSYYKDGDKLKNRLLDNRAWVNDRLYNQVSCSPRTGCPAAVSFEGMSLIRIGFDEYRRFLEAIPASTYSSTSECEGL